MNLIKEKIDKLMVDIKYFPSDNDYVRGYKLYRQIGYINSRFVIIDEPLESFIVESKIYRYGNAILNEYNINTEKYTLLLCRRDEGNKFKLINKKDIII